MPDDRDRHDNRSITLRVEGAMLPAILDALSIGAGTAMAYGPYAKPVRARLKEFHADLARQLGIDTHHAIDVYHWFNACRAVAVCETYGWYEETPTRREGAPLAILVVDGRPFAVFGHDRVARDSPERALADRFFDEYAHVAATRTETVVDWRPYADWRKHLDAKAKPAEAGEPRDGGVAGPGGR